MKDISGHKVQAIIRIEGLVGLISSFVGRVRRALEVGFVDANSIVGQEHIRAGMIIDPLNGHNDASAGPSGKIDAGALL